MSNLIVVVVLITIIGSSIAYVINQKRQGVKCIGCPHGGSAKKKPVQINFSKSDGQCSCNHK